MLPSTSTVRITPLTCSSKIGIEESSSEFAAELQSYSVDVFLAGQPAPHGVGTHDPNVRDRTLEAHAEGGLRPRRVVAARLVPRQLDDELLIEFEQVLEADGAAVGIVGGGGERRVRGQAVGLEVDAGVLQHAAGVGRPGPRLRRLEA